MKQPAVIATDCQIMEQRGNFTLVVEGYPGQYTWHVTDATDTIVAASWLPHTQFWTRVMRCPNAVPPAHKYRWQHKALYYGRRALGYIVTGDKRDE